MSTQIEIFTRDIVENNRTGTLSGRAMSANISGVSGEAGETKAFSILFKAGQLVMCQYANKEGYSAVVDLLNSEAIVKVSWFKMSDTALSVGLPIISTEQLLSMFEDPADSPQASSSAVSITPAMATANAANCKNVTLQAREVFNQFFSDNANHIINRIIKSAGPEVTAEHLRQLYINELTPLLGQDGAAAYFN